MSAMGPELEMETNSYGFIFSKTLVSMFIMAPISNCCFLNMIHTYNFFYFTQALSKNYNPYSKNIESLRLKTFLYCSSGVRFPDWSWGQGNVPHTTLDRLIFQKAPQRVKGCWFPAILRGSLGLGLHKQNDVSQKCGRGPQTVFTLSPHSQWHLPQDIVREFARAGCFIAWKCKFDP